VVEKVEKRSPIYLDLQIWPLGVLQAIYWRGQEEFALRSYRSAGKADQYPATITPDPRLLGRGYFIHRRL